MSKSFDTINIHTLIRKQTEIPGTIIKFIANYIKGHKAYTTYINHTSKQRQFKTGDPQGGVLLPTLFNIYTLGLPPSSAPVYVMVPNDTAYKRWSCHSGFKLLCKLCRTSPAQQWEPDLPFFGHAKPCGPAGWHGACCSHKAGDVETNPGPTTLNKKVWICDICHKLNTCQKADIHKVQQD